MAQRLETFRREVAHWVENNVFKPVAEWNGFVVEGERGQDELVYPKIKFDDLQLRDDTGKLQMLVTANQNGVISNVSLIEAFGFDSDQEIERLRFEQGANFINDQNFGTPNFSLNFSSGPVSGEGFTGGDPGMGGMPPPMPTDMGATPPAPGGAPAGGPAAGGAPPAPTASQRNKMYKMASSISNEIYKERIEEKISKDNTRIASKRIKSAVHEGFLKSMQPVTGRALLGPLQEEYDGLYGVLRTPLFGGNNSLPMNYEAQEELRLALNSTDEYTRQVVAKKVERPQAKMFTNLEKKLYSLVMTVNMPYPLYAQYSAGPTFDYQLDAAIPHLKIGIEADGEIWHNNQEKISKDKRRDSELASNGWIIIRFTDKELQDHPQDCLNVLVKAIKRRSGVSDSGEEYL